MILNTEETVDTTITDMMPVAKVQDVSELAAEQFMTSIEKLETLSTKVSREGLRRVFKIVTMFPYINDDIAAVKNEFELELMKTALYMVGLKDQFAKAHELEQIQQQVGREEADVLMAKAAASLEAKASAGVVEAATSVDETTN